MSRDKAAVLAELLVVVKKISDYADSLPDCGGLQGVATFAAHPEWKSQLMSLSKEAEQLGITPEELDEAMEQK